MKPTVYHGDFKMANIGFVRVRRACIVEANPRCIVAQLPKEDNPFVDSGDKIVSLNRSELEKAGVVTLQDASRCYTEERLNQTFPHRIIVAFDPNEIVEDYWHLRASNCLYTPYGLPQTVLLDPLACWFNTTAVIAAGVIASQNIVLWRVVLNDGSEEMFTIRLLHRCLLLRSWDHAEQFIPILTESPSIAKDWLIDHNYPTEILNVGKRKNRPSFIN